MAQLIVRNIEESVKQGLQNRAKLHGHSMEEEIRMILRESVYKKEEKQPVGLGTQIAELFKDIDFEFEIPRIDEEPRFVKFDEEDE